MSRSGYDDGCGDSWDLIRWRGMVASAIRGKRGQAMLREMRDALDAMPEKRLIAEYIEARGEVCALGAVGRAKGLDLATLDPDDHHTLGGVFNVAPCLIQEVEFINDEWGYRHGQTPEARWRIVRDWVEQNIKTVTPDPQA